MPARERGEARALSKDHFAVATASRKTPRVTGHPVDRRRGHPSNLFALHPFVAKPHPRILARAPHVGNAADVLCSRLGQRCSSPRNLGLRNQ